MPALSRWWMSLRSAWPERLSPKSQDAVALQQIKERALTAIVVISVRQSTVAAISTARRALVMVSSSIRLTA